MRGSSASRHVRTGRSPGKQRVRACKTATDTSPTATGKSSTGSCSRSGRASSAIVAADQAINAAQVELAALVITTIATQAPVAGDLRFVLSLSHITYELERIGDHAAGVAKQVPKVGIAHGPGSSNLDRMGELASGILHGVLRSLVDLDVDEARRVAAQDDEIDKLYHAYFERSLERMRLEPDWVDVGAHLLFAAKDLERIGDRVTNIAEEVVFLATGEVEDLNA